MASRSSASGRRAVTLLLLIGLAEAALLLFAIVPAPYNFVCLFFNGLPLGMVFGLVLGFLEGRRVTEALNAGLCASFILADGVTKSVGAYLLAWGVGQFWMPFAAGLLFVPPLALGVWMLTRIPPPDAADVAQERVAQPLPVRGAAHQAGDVEELDVGGDGVGLAQEAGDPLQARVGDDDRSPVRIDRREGVGAHRRLAAAQGVEDGGLAHVGQADDSRREAHRLGAGSAGPGRQRRCGRRDPAGRYSRSGRCSPADRYSRSGTHRLALSTATRPQTLHMYFPSFTSCLKAPGNSCR